MNKFVSSLLASLLLAPCLQSVASSSQQHQLSQSDHLELIRQSRASFANKTLVVSIIIREPFVIFNEPRHFNTLPLARQRAVRARLENYSGIAIEIVRRLQAIFGFRIRLTHPSDEQFGAYNPENGTWNGLMGQLVRAEADIGVTALSLTINRAHFVDFSRAYYVETATFLIRTPEEIQNYKAIFEPFSSAVWLLLFGTILTLILLISIMTRLEDSQRRQEKAHKLAKFLRSSSVPSLEEARQLAAAERRFSVRLDHRLDELARAGQTHEYGESWLQRFYYAVTCVLNILLIRGK